MLTNKGCCCSVDEDYCQYLYAREGTDHPVGPPPLMSVPERVKRVIKICMETILNG